MGANSKISWTDHTFNPWIGCTKVSPGCAQCYAEREQDLRYGRVKWGKGQPRHRTSASYWKQPLEWNRAADERSQLFGNIPWARRAIDNATHRPRVFCGSLADWLDAEVPIEWLADLLALIFRTQHLDWLLLTKRPQLWRGRLAEAERIAAQRRELATASCIAAWLAGNKPANVWIGVTAEDQEQADWRVPAALRIPARVHFVSHEPALGRIDFFRIDADETGELDALRGLAFCDGRNEPAETVRVNWVIVGGESGPDAREFNLEHALDVIGQCKDAGVPVFVKQFGSRPVTTNANLYDFPDHVDLVEHGTAAAGARVILADRNGRNLTEWPEEFQLQQFPTP
jgi:protein gp37